MVFLFVKPSRVLDKPAGTAWNSLEQQMADRSDRVSDRAGGEDGEDSPTSVTAERLDSVSLSKETGAKTRKKKQVHRY